MSWEPVVESSCLSLLGIHKPSSCCNSTAIFLFLDPSSFSRYQSPWFLAPASCMYLKATRSLTFLAARKGFLHWGGSAVIHSRLTLSVLCLSAAGGSLKTEQKWQEGSEQGLKSSGDAAQQSKAVLFVFCLYKHTAACVTPWLQTAARFLSDASMFVDWVSPGSLTCPCSHFSTIPSFKDAVVKLVFFPTIKVLLSRTGWVCGTHVAGAWHCGSLAQRWSGGCWERRMPDPKGSTDFLRFSQLNPVPTPLPSLKSKLQKCCREENISYLLRKMQMDFFFFFGFASLGFFSHH